MQMQRDLQATKTSPDSSFSVPHSTKPCEASSGSAHHSFLSTHVSAGLALLLTGCLPGGPLEPVDRADTGVPAEVVPFHLELGRALVDRIEDADNAWEVPTEVELGPASWTAQAKCSGLLTRLLEAASGFDLQDRWECDTTVPLAWYWHARITGDLSPDPNLSRVESAHDLKPGDILAIRYLDCDPDLLSCGRENDACDGGSTGHVALVDATPTYRRVGGLLEWTLDVIDSARSGHTAALDSRWRDGEWQDGVGAGPMRLITDLDGQPLAYSWSASADSALVTNTEATIALGRWEEEP